MNYFVLLNLFAVALSSWCMARCQTGSAIWGFNLVAAMMNAGVVASHLNVSL